MKLDSCYNRLLTETTDKNAIAKAVKLLLNIYDSELIFDII